MADARYEKAKALFFELSQLPPEEREQSLERECGDDEELRALVADLLRNDAGTNQKFLTPLSDQDSSAFPTISGFQTIRFIGQGAMGIVYEAIQDTPRRPVALKIIRGRFITERDLRYFQREINALGLLSHSGIAALYQAGRTDDGQHFFAMELVHGIPLTEYLRTNSSPSSKQALRDRLQLFLQICDAIQYAHQRGVIHQDLKPSNMFVVSPDPTTHATNALSIKVLDFGLARILDSNDHQGIATAQSSHIVGTLTHMSPEQTRARQDLIDVRTDVYSLGVVLYEMLTGIYPYELPTDPLAALQAIRDTSPRPLRIPRTSTHRPDPDLETIVLKSLEKDPARRYESVAALAQDLERFLRSEPILARPPSTAYQLRKLVARHKIQFGVAATFLLLLVGFAITLTFQARLIAQEAARAHREAEVSKSVSDFLVEVFNVADPKQTGGTIPSAREVLDAGAARLNSVSQDPVIQRRLLLTVGHVYENLGLYDRAEEYLERSLSTQRGLPEPSLTDEADNLEAIGVVRRLQGDGEGSKVALRQAIALRTAVLGESDLLVASGLHELGNAFIILGQPDSAIVFLEAALRIRESKLDSLDSDIGKTVGNLGNAYSNLGNFPKAEEYFLRSLSIKEKTVGPDHIDTSKPLNNLAKLYLGMEQFERAIPPAKRALEIKMRVLGPDHPEVASSLGALGVAYHELGRLDEAEDLYRRALAIYESKTPESIALPRALSNLAKLLRADRPAEAVATWSKAVNWFDSRHINKDPHLTSLLLDWADHHYQRREYRQSLPLYDRLLDTWGKEVPPTTPGLRPTIERSAEMLRSLGRSRDAATFESEWMPVIALNDQSSTGTADRSVMSTASPR